MAHRRYHAGEGTSWPAAKPGSPYALAVGHGDDAVSLPAKPGGQCNHRALPVSPRFDPAGLKVEEDYVNGSACTAGNALVLGFVLAASALAPAAEAAPPALTAQNVSVTSEQIKIWGVEPTGPVREGSSTRTEAGTATVRWNDGSTSEVDTQRKITTATLFRDGKVCHNYGPKCYCGTTTFRLESGASRWKFGTPSNNEPVACPSGVQPTGDPEIRKALTDEERKARRDEAYRRMKAAQAERQRN